MLLGFYRESNQFALGALEIDVAQLPKGRFFLLNFTQLQHFKHGLELIQIMTSIHFTENYLIHLRKDWNPVPFLHVYY